MGRITSLLCATNTTKRIALLIMVNGLQVSDAFYPVEPGIVMNGAANINFQLTANGAPATVLADSFIAVIQRGILCQNVTTVK